MRYLTSILTSILLLALICVTGAASTTVAQAAESSAVQAKRVSQVDRWVTRPTTITLTTDQRKKLDSISVKYEAESQQIRDQAKGETDISMVLKMRGLATKYQNMVRAILTSSQQAVFDKNVRAGVIGQ